MQYIFMVCPCREEELLLLVHANWDIPLRREDNVFLNFTGAKVAAADTNERQPPESVGRSGEAFRRPLQTVCHGQTGPSET